MAGSVVNLHPGMTCWKSSKGITILRLHAYADPMKAGLGGYESPQVLSELAVRGQQVKWSDRIRVEDVDKQCPNGLTPWEYLEYLKSPSPTMFLQETEIFFDATLGERVYFLYPDATLEKSFPIPPEWTRYFLLDPHPGVPHAAIWVAVDPWGDAWQYRELWPSKIYGKKGNIPQDDNRVTPMQFTEACAWLESAENPENDYRGKSQREEIYKRIIDYAARGFGHTANDEQENQSNYQQRFEAALTKYEMTCPYFEDCIKQGDAGADLVNEWLKPREVDNGRDGWVKKSRYHIFADRCPETILQLNENRRQQLTAVQAEKMDPTGKPIAKRNHCTDLMKYFVASSPVFVDRTPQRSTWKPAHAGIAY